VDVDPKDVRMLDNLLGIKQRVSCDLCGKEVLDLKRHLRNVHAEGKPGCVVECCQCDRKIFLRDMRAHMLNYHIKLEEPPLSDGSPTPSQLLFKEKSETDICKEKQRKVVSFLYDDSDDTDDSDIVIEEIVPPLPNVISDENKNKNVKAIAPPVNRKVQFLVKCREVNPRGGKVKSMRLVMRNTTTVEQAKRKYSNKQVLDKNKIGDLQFVVDGDLLADAEVVEKFDGKIVMAQNLTYCNREQK